MGMTGEKWAALVSIVAALVVVAATYFQWWDVTFDGELRIRRWVRFVLLPGVIALLVVAGILLLSG
jgi:hypothetical protein